MPDSDIVSHIMMAQGMPFFTPGDQNGHPVQVILFPLTVTDNTDAYYSTGPLDVTREQSGIINRNIARLEESSRALETSCLSSLSRLPAEILCNIFSITGIQVEDNSSFFYLRRSTESWTDFRQVSQRWRSSALSASALWTNIPLSYPHWNA
jgi:hypothetical protein